MSSGKLGHLSISLCRAYENGHGDQIAIKSHDVLNIDLLSLNYIQIYPNNYVVGVVWSLTQFYIQT